MNRIYTLIIKEILALWQDKKCRLILIAPPLIQLFVFAFAATLDVQNISLVYFNKDQGKISYELIERFEGSPYFTNILEVHSLQELKKAIDTQKAVIGIHFDSKFSRTVMENKSSGNLQIILDGRKSNTAQIVMGYATQIIEQFNIDLASRGAYHPPSSKLIQRNWFNPNLIFNWFTVPGLVAILTMFSSLLVTSLSIAREREMGTFEQLLVSPLRSIDILAGKALPGVIIGMFEGTLILVAAILVFQIPFVGSVLYFYISMFFFVISITGIGLFLSSICKNQQQALLAVFIFMSNAVILSGFATPIENMPLWLQKCTLINPLRHFIVIVRGTFLKGLPLKFVFLSLYPIILISIATLSTATWFFRKRLE